MVMLPECRLHDEQVMRRLILPPRLQNFGYVSTVAWVTQLIGDCQFDFCKGERLVQAVAITTVLFPRVLQRVPLLVAELVCIGVMRVIQAGLCSACGHAQNEQAQAELEPANRFQIHRFNPLQRCRQRPIGPEGM